MDLPLPMITHQGSSIAAPPVPTKNASLTCVSATANLLNIPSDHKSVADGSFLCCMMIHKMT